MIRKLPAIVENHILKIKTNNNNMRVINESNQMSHHQCFNFAFVSREKKKRKVKKRIWLVGSSIEEDG